MFVVVDGTLAGLIGVADPVKHSTAEAIAELRREGLRIVMLSAEEYLESIECYRPVYCSPD